MYVYNYMHIWQAARNVTNPPASNYGVTGVMSFLTSSRDMNINRLYIKMKKILPHECLHGCTPAAWNVDSKNTLQ